MASVDIRARIEPKFGVLGAMQRWDADADVDVTVDKRRLDVDDVDDSDVSDTRLTALRSTNDNDDDDDVLKAAIFSSLLTILII